MNVDEAKAFVKKRLVDRADIGHSRLLKSLKEDRNSKTEAAKMLAFQQAIKALKPSAPPSPEKLRMEASKDSGALEEAESSLGLKLEEGSYIELRRYVTHYLPSSGTPD